MCASGQPTGSRPWPRVRDHPSARQSPDGTRGLFYPPAQHNRNHSSPVPQQNTPRTTAGQAANPRGRQFPWQGGSPPPWTRGSAAITCGSVAVEQRGNAAKPYARSRRPARAASLRARRPTPGSWARGGSKSEVAAYFAILPRGTETAGAGGVVALTPPGAHAGTCGGRVAWGDRPRNLVQVSKLRGRSPHAPPQVRRRGHPAWGEGNDDAAPGSAEETVIAPLALIPRKYGRRRGHRG